MKITFHVSVTSGFRYYALFWYVTQCSFIATNVAGQPIGPKTSVTNYWSILWNISRTSKISTSKHPQPRPYQLSGQLHVETVLPHARWTGGYVDRRAGLGLWREDLSLLSGIETIPQPPSSWPSHYTSWAIPALYLYIRRTQNLNSNPTACPTPLNWCRVNNFLLVLTDMWQKPHGGHKQLGSYRS
jgi:hypothetical protein